MPANLVRTRRALRREMNDPGGDEPPEDSRQPGAIGDNRPVAPGFSARERRMRTALRTPAGVQRALDATPYHLASTAWSPRRVLRERSAHCLEGAIFAAAVYRTLRELALSYFEGYVNQRGERTLRAYSRPVNLARFDRARPGWQTSNEDVWFVAEHLAGLPHTRLLPRALERRLGRVDRRSLEAGLVGFRQK